MSNAPNKEPELPSGAAAFGPLGKPKQVIVIRQKYPNPANPGATRSLRRGKEIAQGAHASQVALKHAQELGTEACKEWLATRIAKVCVYVQTEEELLKVHADAVAAGLPVGLIRDSGLTEFGGVPTHTALGVGPAYDAELKPVTGHLPLY